jgi:hypothetical protein
VLKYDGKGRALAIVELDVEAVVDSVLDEIANRSYERSVARVRLPGGKRKEVRWHRKPMLIILDPKAAQAGLFVGELTDPEASDAQ